MNQTPFFGVMINQDGTYTDLFSGQTITDSDIKIRNMAPFYGRFIDKDGVEHDLRDISGGGSGGTVMWFDTISARDLYFTQHPTALKKGISVGVGNPVTAYTFNDTWITGALAFRGADGKDGKNGADGKGSPGQAATIEIGTVSTGEPGTDAVVENVGTDTAAVFDFTIPRGADGGGGELPWCEGVFQNRSVPATTPIALNPTVYSGDTSMVEGNHFIVPSTGKYALCIGGGLVSVSTGELLGLITADNPWAPEVSSNIQVAGYHYRGFYIPSLSIIRRFEAGDLLYFNLYMTVAQSTINHNGSTHKFSFTKLSEEENEQ